MDAVVAHRLTETNNALGTRGWHGARSGLLTPHQALLRLGAGDVALNRLDLVAPSVTPAGLGAMRP